MNMERFYSWFVPVVVSPFGHRFGTSAWAVTGRLRDAQWEAPENLKARALLRLRALLDHARNQVPYYRELFAGSGVDPRDIKSLDDLARIPVSSKLDLRRSFPDRVTALNLPLSRRQRMATSGSTGLPFEFYWDRAAQDLLGGTYLFWLEWAGTAIWHTRISIASPSYFYMANTPSAPLRALARRVLIGERTVNLNSDSLTPSQFLSVVADLTSRGAYFIHGYPGSIARLAAGLSDETTSPEHSPRVVVAFAETLTPANAVIIRRVFRCPVANYYSSWEVPQIAHSCPEYPDSLHINLERVIVRVVRPDGTDVAAGEQGHVVLTDLENYVMPFINYFIGDRAVVGSACRCGRGFPTLSDVDGRASEIIRTPSGRYITAGLFGQLLTFVIGVIPYIWEYQVVQRSLNALTLRVVPTADYSREFEGALQRQVEDFLGPDVSVVIEPVARIPVEPSGKRFIIKSELLDNC